MTEIVLDAIAVLLLLVSVNLPWSALSLGSHLLYAVLTVAWAVIWLLLPYAQRAGLLRLPAALNGPLVRLLAAAPLVISALVVVIFDLATNPVTAQMDAAGRVGVGAGVLLALTAALLIARITNKLVALVLSAVVLVLAVLTFVLPATEDRIPGMFVWFAVMTFLALLVIIVTTVVRYFVQGDLAGGLLLVLAGGALALLGAVLGYTWIGNVWFGEITFMWIPVLAAVAAPKVLEDFAKETARGRVWARTSNLAALTLAGVALFSVAGTHLVLLVSDDRRFMNIPTIGPVLGLIFGLLIAAGAVFALISLSNNFAAGRRLALAVAGGSFVLGLILVIREAGLTTETMDGTVLVALVLPAVIVASLLVPPAMGPLADGSQPSAAALFGADTNFANPFEGLTKPQAPAQATAAAAPVQAAQQPVVPQPAAQQPDAQAPQQ